MKKEIMKKVLILFIVFLALFSMSENVMAACADNNGDSAACSKATEDGYKCTYQEKGRKCKKSKVKAPSTPTEPENPDEPEEEGKGCRSYSGKPKEVCNSHTEDGYKCKRNDSRKGFPCEKSNELTDSGIEERRKSITSCSDIGSDRQLCIYSYIKEPGDEHAHKCIWRQGSCYKGTETEYTESIIASNKEQSKEQREKYKDENGKETTASTWNSEDGNTNKFLKKVWGMLKVIVPVLVIVLSIADFLKVLIISDEKNYKEAYTRLLKRIAVGIILFVLPALIKLVLDLAGLQDTGIFEVFS